jgi:hypothetical protein
MMPTSPSSPLRFRTAGFPQYGSKAGLSDGAFPAPAPVKPAPGIPIAELKFASILHAPRRPRLSPLSVGGPDPVVHRHAGDLAALPQGPSLRSGLCCPDPSSLNRPHPPHSQAHRDFAAERLIRDAFAVRERQGDPRVVPRFRCPFLPNMSFPASPGSLALRVPSSFATSTAFAERPTARHSRCQPFRGLLIRLCYDLLSCSPPFRRLLLPGFRWVGRPSHRRI